LRCVDAINTFRVIASRFTLFRVVSRSQIQYFRSSRRFMRLVRFPAAPQERNLARATSCGQFSFSSTFVVEIHSMTSLRLRPTGLRTPGALCVHQTVDWWSPPTSPESRFPHGGRDGERLRCVLIQRGPSSLARFGRWPIGGAINCAACRQRGLNGGVHERVVDRPDGR
jgi:hypothetical protein